MAITIRKRTFGALHWGVDEDNLVFPNLISRGERKFFALNPDVIDGLGDKDSILTTPQINENLVYLTSSDLSVLAATYADANWTAKGWDVTTDASIFAELSTFVANNFNQQGINTNLTDMVIVLTRGSIGGTEYTIPFAYFGVDGENEAEPFMGTSLLMHFDYDTSDDSGNGQQLVLTGPEYRYGHADGNDEFTSILLHGNSSTGFVDDSPINHSMSQTGSNTYSTSAAFGTTSFSFVATGFPTPVANDRRISCSSDSSFDFGSGDFCIEFWATTTGIAGTEHVVNRWNSGGGDWYIAFLSATSIRFHSALTGNVDASFSDVSALIGNFRHFAVSREGNTLYIWVNGIVKATAAMSGTLQFSPAIIFSVGAQANTFTNKFSRLLDEVRVSKGTARFSPSGFSPFLDAYGTPGEGGKFEKALRFTSSSCLTAEVTPNGAFDLGDNDFTIDFWVNFPFFTGIKRIVNIYPGTFSIHFNNTSSFVCVLSDGQNETTISGSPGVGTLSWNHYAVVRSGDNVTLYVNGVVKGTGTFTGSLGTPTELFTINGVSGAPSADGFSGLVDELRIVKGTAEWTAAFTPPAVPYTS